MNPAAWPYLFPLIRAGGLFILIMGIGVLSGAILPARRMLLVMVGAALATIAVVVFAAGLHFIPMSVAFGPLCVALGLVLSLLAGVGFWLRPDISLDRLWAADGLIKIGFGAAMLFIWQ